VYRVEFYPVGRYDCISIVVLDDSSLMFRCSVLAFELVDGLCFKSSCVLVFQEYQVLFV